MPRTYRLGKRAVSTAETRDRIVEAAIELYRANGLSGTSMAEVARRADVAPGTVLNHFSTPDELAAAVARRIIADLRVPDPAELARLASLDERIGWLARELTGFYERGEAWWFVYQRDPGRSPAWAETEVAVNDELEHLVRLALGRLASDEVALTLTATVLGPAVIGSLRGRGMSGQGAAELAADLLLGWLHRRRRPADP